MIYAGAVAVYSAIRIAVLGRFSEAPHLFQASWRMGAGAAGLLGQHAKLFFWPVHLSIFRSFNLAASLHSPWPVVSLLILVAALFLRKREPMVGFLIIWWGVTLLPCLDVRQVSSAVADRFSLLPTVGPCLVLAYFAFDWLPRHVVASSNHSYPGSGCGGSDGLVDCSGRAFGPPLAR